MHVSGALRSILAVASVGAALLASPAWSAMPAAGAVLKTVDHSQATRSPDSGPAVHHDTSPPLRELSQRSGQLRRASDPAPPSKRPHPPSTKAAGPDRVVQDRNGSRGRIRLGVSFEGIREGGGTPPDPNASVGSRQIVEITNFKLAVYSKSGATLLGPLTTETLFRGFGGPCETAQNAFLGDPEVRWDSLAHRWIINQFARDDVTNTNRLCVGVSRTSDATGEYYRYAFGYQNLPDHPKFAVWPDAYYVTATAAGSLFEACAWDRHRMLRGADADQQCYTLPASTIPLGSDLDGTTPPPRGEPNLLINLGPTDDRLQYWRFHVDWAHQARTTLTGPEELRVAPYTRACESTDPTQCVPQAGTTQKLDSLSYSPMYRFAYRNFGDHQSLVVNHAVDARGGVGVRWYELRLHHGRPVVHQQSTYAPGPTYRWMGSAAQNKVGDIALGYSQSSSRTHPSIRVTGRLAHDPRNLMTFHETTVWTGAGSQTGSNRWGDYTSMAIDPVDDCTFWYTNQYQPADGTGNWNTRIVSFRLSDCHVHRHHHGHSRQNGHHRHG
ncbi:hypothetical protein [Streptomyces hygroscopicus]|uniref:hypothetical protein n=1 Tax=Streptomyces hygroscopicus TaxID=1912 RepID=UPI000B163C29|nr:hypothetical protein [Streptomyces hygroscopicus]